MGFNPEDSADAEFRRAWTRFQLLGATAILVAIGLQAAWPKSFPFSLGVIAVSGGAWGLPRSTQMQRLVYRGEGRAATTLRTAYVIASVCLIAVGCTALVFGINDL